jgi:hypothetical protein
MQNIINTLVNLGIYDNFKPHFEFDEEILIHILEQWTDINPDDVDLEALAEALTYGYYRNRVRAQQGFTLDAHLQSPTTGYMVSLKGTEVQFPNVADMPDDVLQRECDDFDCRVPKNRYFGAWVDDGTLYLDHSVNIQDREVAIAFGHANNQLAIWDIANGKSIRLD